MCQVLATAKTTVESLKILSWLRRWLCYITCLIGWTYAHAEVTCLYELCWAHFGSVVLIYLARGAESRC